MIETSRRKFLIGASALIAAPAIVKASSLMPVRGTIMDSGPVLQLPSSPMYFRYVIATESGLLSNVKWWDFESNIALQHGDTFRINLEDGKGTVTFADGKQHVMVGQIAYALSDKPPD